MKLPSWTLTAVVVGAIVFASVWEIASVVRYGGDQPSDDNWKDAALWLEGEARVGDVFESHPAWIEPLVRQWFGRWMTLDSVTQADPSNAPRRWIVQVGKHEASAARSKVFGPLTLSLVESAVKAVSWRMDTLIGVETVGRVYGGIQEVDFEPRKCLTFAPAANASAYGTKTVTGGGTLVGFAGIADIFTRRDNTLPALVHVKWRPNPEGEFTSIATEEIHVDRGWHRFQGTIPASGQVKVEVSAPGKENRNRLVCTVLELRS